MNIVVGIREILKNNRILKKTIYPLGFKVSKLLKYRQKLLQKYGFEVLQLVDIIATRNNIPYYLDWGTLLGIIRESGFIKHDDDMDFSILPCNVPIKPFILDMLNQGFIFDCAFLLNNRDIIEFRMRYKDISVDFFNPVERNELLVFIEKDRSVGYPKPTMERIAIHDFHVNVPSNVDVHLEWCYGNWIKPEKNFDSSKAELLKSFMGYEFHNVLIVRDLNKVFKCMN